MVDIIYKLGMPTYGELTRVNAALVEALEYAENELMHVAVNGNIALAIDKARAALALAKGEK